MNGEQWPRLRLAEWEESYETLHRWSQLVGKVRLGLSPYWNHYWQVALYVTARGLTTSPIPYGGRTFEILFDLVDHQLRVETLEGQRKSMPLFSRSVADFHHEFLGMLHALEIDVHLWSTPVEISDPIPLDQDQKHATYDPAHVEAFFRVLTQADQALKAFMGRFQGKQSPSHFFWGAFDLAQTRFSSRPAPVAPNADRLRALCYSHEVLSFGFWPGSQGVTDAAFYAYAVPEPSGFAESPISTPGAAYHDALREFLLPYEVVRKAESPRDVLLKFFQEVYEAGATLGQWDRASLEPHWGEMRPAHF